MKTRLTALFLFFGVYSFCQPATSCTPAIGGAMAGDHPPGCFVCSIIYEGSTSGYTDDRLPYSFPCGKIENSQFLQFRAGETGEVQLIISPTHCQNDSGVEMIVYDENFNIVSDCYSSEGFSLPGELIINDLNPGEKYMIMIDGYEGDHCDFQLFILGGWQPSPPTSDNFEFNIAPAKPFYCQGTEVCYTAPTMSNADFYLWGVPTFSEIIAGGFPTDNFICLKFNGTGKGLVELTPYNNCFLGSTFSKNVEVTAPIDTFFRLPEFFCKEDFPLTIDGFLFEESGVHYGAYQRPGECDSVVKFWLQESWPLDYNYTSNLCQGECAILGDSCYFENTLINAGVNRFGCDSLVNVTVNNFDTIPGVYELESIRFSHILSFRWKFFGSWNSFFSTTESRIDGFRIEINGNFIDSIQPNDSYPYWLEPDDSIIHFKIQPFGDAPCLYESKEIIHDLRTSLTLTPFHESGIKIHPNPTNGQVQIESEAAIERVKVFDISGRQVLTSKQPNVSLSNQPAGIYFFRIETADGVAVKRIIKN